MSAEEQTEKLARFILNETSGPNLDEGAGDTAIRLLRSCIEALDRVIHEIGVPGDNYPANISNAYAIARNALSNVRSSI